MADLTLLLKQAAPAGSRKVNAPVAQHRKDMKVPVGFTGATRVAVFSLPDAPAGPATVDSSGKIYGTVLMEGVLTKGVRVSLYSRDTGRLLYHSSTAADGSFTFKGLNSNLSEGYFVVAFDPAGAPNSTPRSSTS